MRSRTLDWEALRNARDLGGLPLRAGGETRFGSIVRSDTVRQLTPPGWSALAAYGIETIVDLRLQVEVADDRLPDDGAGWAFREAGLPGELEGAAPRLRRVGVSLLGEPDRRIGEELDAISRAQHEPAASTRAVYLAILDRFRAHVARAVAAVADAPPGGVLVHCHAGKDRTGLVVALVLGVAGVDHDAVAEDYAESGPNIAPSIDEWVQEAGDDPDEREHRRRVGLSSRDAMVDVLGELERRYGGPASYLRDAGLSEADLQRVRARLV